MIQWQKRSLFLLRSQFIFLGTTNCNPFFLDAFAWEKFRTYTAGAAIPIGIAVGRQRLQETTTNQSLPQLQPKDLNRFSLGLADLGEFESKGN